MLNISDKELLHISKLSVEKRYGYFIKRICNQQELAVLKNENNTFQDESNFSQNYIHLWSAVEFGKKYLEFTKYKGAVSIIKFDFVGNMFIEYGKFNNILVSIMSINENIGYERTIEQLFKDIQA